eukprot:1160389-Prymnesium_polylepis.1
MLDRIAIKVAAEREVASARKAEHVAQSRGPTRPMSAAEVEAASLLQAAARQYSVEADAASLLQKAARDYLHEVRTTRAPRAPRTRTKHARC